MADFYTVSEYAKLTGKDASRIRRLLAYGKLSGEKLGNQWIIPKDAVYPEDERVKSGRYRNWRKTYRKQNISEATMVKEDPFKDYLMQKEPDKREKGYYWQTAIGLQKVDGLQPSEYLLKTAIRNIEGQISIEEAGHLLDSYYQERSSENADDRVEEADKVSQRIAKILAEKAFSFTPNEYISIHRKLFEGIYAYAGKMRDYNISKKEWVLDGATVLYGSASELRATLEYDFSQERNFSYRGLTMDETIRHLARFISRLWQIHVFGEGNTRTTAVFLIKYLRKLGFDVTNSAFAENAWYFRNAMVRANYSDIKNHVHETTEYLELFLRNLLLGEQNELHNREMHISGAFSKNSKQDIGELKQDIEAPKQDIGELKQDIGVSRQNIGELQQDTEVSRQNFERTAHFSARSIQNIKKLLAVIGYDVIFGRKEVMHILGLTASPASSLLSRMKNGGVVECVVGCGKGKYRFVK